MGRLPRLALCGVAAASAVFGLEFAELGELTMLRVGHDNAGGGAAWCLEKIVVEHGGRPHERW
jgi:hypothetical protein